MVFPRVCVAITVTVTAICDARLIYRRGDFMGIYMLCIFKFLHGFTGLIFL